MASEHGPGQKLHLALLGEQPAAGNISHSSLGLWTTVSFNTPPSFYSAFFFLFFLQDCGPTCLKEWSVSLLACFKQLRLASSEFVLRRKANNRDQSWCCQGNS